MYHYPYPKALYRLPASTNMKAVVRPIDNSTHKLFPELGCVVVALARLADVEVPELVLDAELVEVVEVASAAVVGVTVLVRLKDDVDEDERLVVENDVEVTLVVEISVLV